jgi:hypothetical protein
MPSNDPAWSITYFDQDSFLREVSGLTYEARFITRFALDLILLKEAISLARTPWLKSLGGSLWEFRIGPSAKAVLSKAGDSTIKFEQNCKVLVRVYCTFKTRQIIVFGLYDKQRYGAGARQSKSIAMARKKLLTFKEEE